MMISSLIIDTDAAIELSQVVSSSSSQKLASTPSLVFLGMGMTIVTLLFILANYENKKDSVKSCKNGSLPPVVSQSSCWECIVSLLGTSKHCWLLQQHKRLQYPGIFRIPVMNLFNLYVVVDAKLSKQILQDPTTTKEQLIFGNLVNEVSFHRPSLTSTPDQSFRWRHAKKSIRKGFNEKERMRQTIKDYTYNWMTNLRQQQSSNDGDNKSNVVPILFEMQKLTAQIFCDYALDYQPTHEETITLVEGLNRIMEEKFHHSLQNPLFRIPFWFCYQEARQAKQAQQNIYNFLTKTLESYKSKTTSTPQQQVRNTNLLLDAIIHDPNYESDKDRLADLVLLLGGAYQMTSTTLSWALLELAKNPQLQNQLRNQQSNDDDDDDKNNNNNDNSRDDAEDGSTGNLVQYIVKEALRMYPPVPMGVPRVLGRSFDYQNTTIPKGSLVAIPPILPHHDPNCFKEPHRFLPSRWNSSSQYFQEGMANCYIPYSSGPRRCSGMVLANMELTTMLRIIVQESKIISVDYHGKSLYKVTLQPDGLQLLIEQ